MRHLVSPEMSNIIKPSRSMRRRASNSIISALAFFVSFQLVFNLVVQRRHIELRDPEYGYRLTTLKGGIRREPDRPLLILLGSSRTELGIVPSQLQSGISESDKSPFVFNMALAGSGPVLELLCLKRLLAEGIHPRWVMIEVLPATLFEEPVWSNRRFLDVNRLSVEDLQLLSKYTPVPDRLLSLWVESHVVPCDTHRFLLMSRYAPQWLPQGVRTDEWRIMDQNGYHHGVFSLVGAEQLRPKRIVIAERQYASALKRFVLSSISDRAMHDLLDLCYDQHIQPLLYLMPEGDQFRSWYPPAVDKSIRTYLEKLTQEYGLPLVDARKWMREEDFVDSHHLVEPSAWAFSKRFGTEISQSGFLNKNTSSEESVRPLTE